MKFDGMPGFGMLVVGRRISSFETGLNDDCRYCKYASYENRLMSFLENGEIDSRYSREEFAKAGLFRTGEADECACFHCGNLICGWEYEDDPLEQHEKCSLNCPFVERVSAQKKMRMTTRSIGGGLRMLDVPFRRPLDFWDVAVSKERPDDFADDHRHYRDDVMNFFAARMSKIADDIARRNAEEEGVHGQPSMVNLHSYADFARKMREEEFRYSPDLLPSPGWAMIEDEPLQKRGSLKQVIKTGIICQLDEYCRDTCFEVLFASQNDMQKKSENLDGQNENVRKHQTDMSPGNAVTNTALEQNLDGQNENVRKNQTDTSPGNAVTDTAPEQSDVQDEDVDEEIRALEQLLICKVCLDKDSCIVFFPCRHMATCESCEQFLQRCPVCRASIDEAVKINEE